MFNSWLNITKKKKSLKPAKIQALANIASEFALISSYDVLLGGQGGSKRAERTQRGECGSRDSPYARGAAPAPCQGLVPGPITRALPRTPSSPEAEGAGMNAPPCGLGLRSIPTRSEAPVPLPLVVPYPRILSCPHSRLSRNWS